MDQTTLTIRETMKTIIQTGIGSTKIIRSFFETKIRAESPTKIIKNRGLLLKTIDVNSIVNS